VPANAGFGFQQAQRKVLIEAGAFFLCLDQPAGTAIRIEAENILPAGTAIRIEAENILRITKVLRFH